MAPTEPSSRQQRERDFHNDTFARNTRAPAAKFYEIHRASRDAYARQIHERPDDTDVLEYGCGRGSAAFDLAAAGARVTGIDISDVAIDQATARAAELGVADRSSFLVMDAERLACADASFDLVCGTSILHHLDLDHAYGEIARVLRPGGHGVFLEALGHNPLINLYRRRTPLLRTVDEHPLRVGDLELARRYFSGVSLQYFNLASLAALPLRRRAAFPAVADALERLDQLLFRRIPYLRRHAWMAVLRLTR
jgi:ubiquinone/menaquinone biosynthesis C-methylase UbiE